MPGDRRQRRAGVGVVLVVATLTAVVFTLPGAGDTDRSTSVQAADTDADVAVSANAVGNASRYVPINPIRVLDTRTDIFRRRVPANGSFSIAPVNATVSNASGVAAGNAQSVVLNVTMVEAGAPGYATLWPTGSAQPNASSLNADFPGQTVPNMVTVPLGTDGFISLYSFADADYIIDVQGVYESATSATAGRLVPLPPRRAIDTRPGNPVGPNGTITVDLTTVGVPASASAAVLNVTATETFDAGYFTVSPADTPTPLASNLNVPSPGYTVANQVIARVSGGRVNVYSWAGGDVIVDVTGYMTGASSPPATDGLFVALAPRRLLDTRTPGPFSTGTPLFSGNSIALPIAGREGVPASGVQSVALNVTATRTLDAGYDTTWPANTPIPATSSLNFVGPGRTVPNHVITQLNGGAAAFYSFGGNDLLVDVMGYWTDPTGTIPTSGGNITLSTVNPPPTTIPPPGPPTLGAYGFLYQPQPKSPNLPYGRWNPCAPIVYLVNADRATQAMVDQMNAAIAEIELATSLDFVYGGPTSGGLNLQVPFGADVIIGFSDEAATPQLSGSVIGIGGGSYSQSTGRVGKGFALADVANFQSQDAATLAKLRGTLTHEIGHLVGLDHVGDIAQLMYSFATSNNTLQGGDRRGLWFLGAAQGCQFAGGLIDDPVGGSGAVSDPEPPATGTTPPDDLIEPPAGPAQSDSLPDDAVVVFAG